MASQYSMYHGNLMNWYNNVLTHTKIKFLFFNALNLNQPMIRDELRYCSSQKSYVAESCQKNGFYVYRESVIKYLVTNVQRVSPSAAVSTATITGHSSQSDVNHGDHLTFILLRKRSPKDSVVVKAHKTTYEDLSGSFVFSRYNDECNFTFDKVSCFPIQSIQCESSKGLLKGITLAQEIQEKEDQKMIEKLLNVMSGTDITSGGAKGKRNNEKVRYKNRYYVLRKGVRRGQYIQMKGGNKVYLQSGGSYKDITFMSDTFLSFLSNTLFTKVRDLRADLYSITIIYDELNECKVGGHEHIVILYDFEHDRNIFYLDTALVLKACYAESKIMSGGVDQLTSEEKECYKRYQDLINVVVSPVLVV